MKRKVWIYQQAGMWVGHVQQDDGCAPRSPTHSAVTKQGLIAKVNATRAEGDGFEGVESAPCEMDYTDGQLPDQRAVPPAHAQDLMRSLRGYAAAEGIQAVDAFVQDCLMAVLDAHELHGAAAPQAAQHA